MLGRSGRIKHGGSTDGHNEKIHVEDWEKLDNE